MQVIEPESRGLDERHSRLCQSPQKGVINAHLHFAVARGDYVRASRSDEA